MSKSGNKGDSFRVMSDLNSLSVDAVKSFMLSKGGKVTNHELVKQFKAVLTNPETRGVFMYLRSVLREVT